MKVTLYSASVPVMTRHLKALDALLEKGIAYCAQKKVDQSAIVNDRLYPDMLIFAQQVRNACEHAKGAVARLSGTENPAFADDETTLEQLRARVAKTLTILGKANREAIEGAVDRDVTVRTRAGEVQMNGGEYFLTNALPNFFFHYTTAYAIMRHRGIEIGKSDYMGPKIEA